MTYSLRIATPDDAAAIQAIYEPYVKETAITFEYDAPCVKTIEQRIVSTLEKYPWIVAEEEGQVVGYAYAGTFKGRKAYDWSVESSVYVRKDLRTKGVGRALYTELESILKRQGITNINACIAYTENDTSHLTDASVKFHEKLGFKMVGVFHQCAYKFGTWYDMCWMEKHIAEHMDHNPEVVPFSKMRDGD